MSGWETALIRDIAADLSHVQVDLSVNCKGLVQAIRELQVAANILACGTPTDQSSITTIEALMQRAYHSMAANPDAAALSRWRRIYTDACILVALAKAVSSPAFAIKKLDSAIIIAGASGSERLDLVHHIISQIQTDFLSHLIPTFAFQPEALLCPSSVADPELLSAGQRIPVLSTPPSLSSFQNKYSRAPFILRAFASDWPALRDHPWASTEYLRYVAGPGRVVPVEVGQDYRRDDWTQKLMDWDDFLTAINLSNTSSAASEADVLYLAQHDLLMQFPALRADICVPDYVYASLTDADFPGYKPPGNEDQLIINAWLGPLGTVSPAHNDPYHNIYVQVVGSKTIWLASADSSASMYPFLPSDRSSLSVQDTRDPSMANTSRVDVFADDDQRSLNEHPAFWEDVVPAAMYATLHPGDMLFFPAGWWHAMRSESASFSVSMWF